MSEIDDIINQFSRIPVDIKTSSSNTTNMPAQVNWDLFRSRLENIKPYDGNPINLNKFITRCEQFITIYQQIQDTELDKHVLECIQEKLIDKAEFMVGIRVELNTWELIKNALIQCFSDKRDLDCLILELSRSKLHKNENLHSFGSRLQLIRSKVTHRIINDTRLNQNDKTCRINHYNKVARDTFISECTGTLKNNLHLKNPDTLEDAMTYVSEFENFEKYYGNTYYSERPRNSHTNTDFNRQTQHKHLKQNHYRQIPMTSQPFPEHMTPRTFPQNFNQETRHFPSQPINVQPRFIPQRRLPTNSEVFGKPRNVFKPNPQVQKNLPPPEPMSTTSRATTRNSNNNFYPNQFNPRYDSSRGHFQNNNQNPNFHNEELFYKQFDENSENYTYEQSANNQQLVTEYYEQEQQIENEQNSSNFDYCENENSVDFQTTASNENQT